MLVMALPTGNNECHGIRAAVKSTVPVTLSFGETLINNRELYRNWLVPLFFVCHRRPVDSFAPKTSPIGGTQSLPGYFKYFEYWKFRALGF